jgi:type IV secretion system protein VirB4
MKGWMFDGVKIRKATAQKALDYFKNRIATFEDVFSSLFTVCRRLQATALEDELGFTGRRDSLLRYVRRCVTGLDHPFLLPDIPIYLNQHIASEDFVGGIEPRMGRKHLGALDSLPIEFRWNTRAILMDPEEAGSFLNKTRKKWKARVRGFKDTLFRTETGSVNLHAQEMAVDAEEAMSVASAGDVQFAFYSTNIVCGDEDEDRLDDSVALVAKTIRNLGYSARVETVNAVEAWRGSLPCGCSAYHISLGGPARESVASDARPESSAAIRGNDRSYAVSLQPSCWRFGSYADGRTARKWQVNLSRTDSCSMVPISARTGVWL